MLHAEELGGAVGGLAEADDAGVADERAEGLEVIEAGARLFGLEGDGGLQEPGFLFRGRVADVGRGGLWNGLAIDFDAEIIEPGDAAAGEERAEDDAGGDGADIDFVFVAGPAGGSVDLGARHVFQVQDAGVAIDAGPDGGVAGSDDCLRADGAGDLDALAAEVGDGEEDGGDAESAIGRGEATDAVAEASAGGGGVVEGIFKTV